MPRNAETLASFYWTKFKPFMAPSRVKGSVVNGDSHIRRWYPELMDMPIR